MKKEKKELLTVREASRLLKINDFPSGVAWTCGIDTSALPNQKGEVYA